MKHHRLKFAGSPIKLNAAQVTKRIRYFTRYSLGLSLSGSSSVHIHSCHSSRLANVFYEVITHIFTRINLYKMRRDKYDAYASCQARKFSPTTIDDRVVLQVYGPLKQSTRVFWGIEKHFTA